MSRRVLVVEQGSKVRFYMAVALLGLLIWALVSPVEAAHAVTATVSGIHQFFADLSG